MPLRNADRCEPKQMGMIRFVLRKFIWAAQLHRTRPEMGTHEIWFQPKSLFRLQATSCKQVNVWVWISAWRKQVPRENIFSARLGKDHFQKNCPNLLGVEQSAEEAQNKARLCPSQLWTIVDLRGLFWEMSSALSPSAVVSNARKMSWWMTGPISDVLGALLSQSWWN